jgi:hypothetical protein
MTDTFTTLLDDATAGLKDDPELRLDVRAELASHLEAIADAYEAEGHEEAASRELAAQDFGSPAEVAGELLAANKRRMTLRALVRLFLRAVVVPAAVVVAIFVGYGGVVRVMDLLFTLAQETSAAAEANPVPVLPHLPFTQTPPQRWVARGVPELLAEALRQPGERVQRARAAYQAHAHGDLARAYYAQYAMTLVTQTNPSRIAEMAAALCEGQRLDPDNALYDYLLARVYLQQAVKITTQMPKRRDWHYGHWTRMVPRLAYTLQDRALLEPGRQAVAAGMRKPALRTYHLALIRRKLAALPPARRIEDAFDRQVIAYGEPLMECNILYTVVWTTPYLGKVLLHEGRVAEGEAMLGAWHTIARQTAADAFTQYQLLSMDSNAAAAGTAAARVYDAQGRHTDAAQMRQALHAFLQPMTKLRESRRSTRDDYFHQQLMPRMGFLAWNMMAVIGTEALRPADLLPVLRLEQTFYETIILDVLLLLLVLLLVECLLQVGILRLRLRGQEATPLLLLPDGLEMLRIVGWGILLPLAVYVAYTHTGLSGREYGYHASTLPFYRLVGELAVLTVVLLVAPARMAKAMVRRRCARLGIPVPPLPRRYTPGPVTRAVLHLLLLAAGAGVVWFFLSLVDWFSLPIPNPVSLTLACLAAGATLVGVGFFVRNLYRQLTHPGTARPTDSDRPLLFVLISLATLAVLAVALYWCGIFLNANSPELPDGVTLGIACVATSAALVGLALLFRRFLLTPPSAEVPAQYHGTVARSLVPVYAVAILLLAAMARPYLAARESHWLHRDRVFLMKSDSLVDDLFEMRLVAHTRQALLKEQP